MCVCVCARRYETHEIALNCGMMLRECCRYEALAKIMLYSAEFYKFFSYVEVSTFDIASDAFSTFKVSGGFKLHIYACVDVYVCVLFVLLVFGPDITLCGWLVSKRQLTDRYLCLLWVCACCVCVCVCVCACLMWLTCVTFVCGMYHVTCVGGGGGAVHVGVCMRVCMLETCALLVRMCNLCIRWAYMYVPWVCVACVGEFWAHNLWVWDFCAVCDLQELITKHRALSAEFLEKNYDKFFTHYQQLLYSENYVTRRQALKVTNTSIDLQIGWDSGGWVEWRRRGSEEGGHWGAKKGGQRRGGHWGAPFLSSVSVLYSGELRHSQSSPQGNQHSFWLAAWGGWERGVLFFPPVAPALRFLWSQNLCKLYKSAWDV